MGISRRRFIAMSGAALALPLVGIGMYATTDQMIVSILKKHLPGIEFDPDSLAVYLDLNRKYLDSVPRRLTTFVDTHINPMLLPNVAREKLADIERILVSNFLMGSDYFWLPNPESRLIKYTGEVDVCGNPFARFDAHNLESS